MAARKRVLIKALERQVIETIKGYDLIQKEDSVLVALSGGADSVFLLHFLTAYKQYYRIKLAAMHINHGLRGEAADADEQFCKDLCLTLNIPFHSATIDIKLLAKNEKFSVEEAGRVARYNAFTAKIAELGFNKIATAHHADDNLESLLLNLAKGCGINGLRGIAPVRDGNIIRPLLALKKADIVEALQAAGSGWCTDASNLDDNFERNRIRINIIPQLRTINPEVAEAVLRLSDNVRAITDISTALIIQLEELAVTGQSLDEFHLRVAPLMTALPVLRTALIIKTAEERLHLPLTKKLAEQIAGLAEKRPGSRIAIGKRFSAHRERELIVIGESAHKPDKSILFELTAGKGTNIDGVLLSLERVARSEIAFSRDGMTEFIDARNITLPLTVRYWRPGDKFVPLGMTNRKNVSDFLAEQKVASKEKPRRLVVCSGDEIVWVVGLRIDERFRIKDNSNNIIKLKVEIF